MHISSIKTVIKREDMARIFEMENAGFSLSAMARRSGYSRWSVKRGLVIAKLFGFEAVK